MAFVKIRLNWNLNFLDCVKGWWSTGSFQKPGNKINRVFENLLSRENCNKYSKISTTKSFQHFSFNHLDVDATIINHKLRSSDRHVVCTLFNAKEMWHSNNHLFYFPFVYALSLVMWDWIFLFFFCLLIHEDSWKTFGLFFNDK